MEFKHWIEVKVCTCLSVHTSCVHVRLTSHIYCELIYSKEVMANTVLHNPIYNLLILIILFHHCGTWGLHIPTDIYIFHYWKKWSGGGWVHGKEASRTHIHRNKHNLHYPLNSPVTMKISQTYDSGPPSDSVIWSGRNSHTRRTFIGLLHWVPVATDQIVCLSLKVDQGL